MRSYLFLANLLTFLLLTNVSAVEQKKPIDRGVDLETKVEFPFERVSYEFEIDSLPYLELTNTTYSYKMLSDTSKQIDGHDIVLIKVRGKQYYHPVNMCHRAYHLVAAYRETGDTTHLNLAKRYVARLIRESENYDGALYYPYWFNHNVHGISHAALKAPWYSGMAQGEILGLMVRMFWATGDSLYIDYAQKTFKSFLRPRGEFHPWTVFVDSIGCYWIEEYPTENPSMTLNGFIYSLYGVYDYYLLTKDKQVEKVLKDCLSTLKNYIPTYRRPGKASWYGLQFQYWSQPYHKAAHIPQFRQLFKITKDEFFNEWGDIFEQDFK